MNEERPHRQERIAELLKRVVGEIMSEKVDFSESLVTVSAVHLSPNHQHATIFVTVFPYKAAKEAMEVLKTKVASIQKDLNKKLRMRPVPKITFHLDDSEEKGRKILDLLDKVK